MEEPNIVTADPITRKSKRTGLSMLDKVTDAYGLNDSALSEALGYSKTAVTHWRKDGAMPAVAGLACECLMRRKGNADDKAQASVQGAYELLCIDGLSTAAKLATLRAVKLLLHDALSK